MTNGDVAPAGNYRPHQPVWIWRSGTWRPGDVLAASHRAVTVIYQLTQHPGTVVDTVTADMLRERTNNQPPTDLPGGAVR